MDPIQLMKVDESSGNDGKCVQNRSTWPTPGAEQCSVNNVLRTSKLVNLPNQMKMPIKLDYKLSDWKCVSRLSGFKYV